MATPAPTPPDPQRDAAMEIVRVHTGLCVASHFLPVPFLGSAFIAGIHLQMSEALALHYGVPFDARRARALLHAIATGAVHAAIVRAPLHGLPLRSLAWPALLATFTYQLGKSYVDHYESGGRFEDFSPDRFLQASLAAVPA
jgi:uncharacterized protein (DUF697 family)